MYSTFYGRQWCAAVDNVVYVLLEIGRSARACCWKIVSLNFSIITGMCSLCLPRYLFSYLYVMLNLYSLVSSTLYIPIYIYRLLYILHTCIPCQCVALVHRPPENRMGVTYSKCSATDHGNARALGIHCTIFCRAFCFTFHQ